MWGFVNRMASKVQPFVMARRKRCPAPDADAAAFGSGCEPNPPLRAASMPRKLSHSKSAMSLCSVPSMGSMEAIQEDESSHSNTSEGGAGSSTRRHAPPKKAKTLKGIAAFAVASSLAMIMHRSSSCSSLGSGGGGGGGGGASTSDLGDKALLSARTRNRHNRYRYSERSSDRMADRLW
jgi:hypothetical protein